MSKPFDMYVVGSLGPPDGWNPQETIKRYQAWPILQALSEGPVTQPFLAERSGLSVQATQDALEQLLRLGLARCSGGEYSLGFAWYSQADQDAIYRKTWPVATHLAERIYARRSEIDRQIDQVTARTWSELCDLRFALVGCFGLDWGGLETLKASGHLIHEKEQPGGRRYVLYAQESVEGFTQKDYAGSHSMAIDPTYTWSSFGDHSGRRFGLPDLVWELPGAVQRDETVPAPLRPLLGTPEVEGLDLHLGAAAEALVGLTRGEAPQGIGLSLLTAASALREGKPAIPIFFRQPEGQVIDGVVGAVQETLLAVVQAHYTALQTSLGDIGPLRSGISFGECFNLIWHVIFGQTNRVLAEQGYLADPEPTYPNEGRYRWWLTIS